MKDKSTFSSLDKKILKMKETESYKKRPLIQSLFKDTQEQAILENQDEIQKLKNDLIQISAVN